MGREDANTPRDSSKVVEESSKANRDSGHLLLQSAQQAGDVLQQSFDKVEQRLDGSIGNIGKEMTSNLQEIHKEYSHSLEYLARNLRGLADLHLDILKDGKSF